VIIEIENFFTKKRCNKLIMLNKKNKLKLEKHKSEFLKKNSNTINLLKGINWVLEEVNLLEKQVNKLIKNCKCESIEIAEWPPNTHQPFHQDIARKKTVFSSIVYLNEDYEGGATIFENGQTIKPKTGKVVFFNGVKYFHAVERVKKNFRYTLAAWYKNA
jgi:hypothetical protein